MQVGTKLFKGALAQHSIASCWIVFAITLIVTLLAWDISYRHTTIDAEERFQQRTGEIAAAITERFEGYQQVMRGAVGLWVANSHVDRRAWQHYFNSLQLGEHYPGIQGLGYAQLIQPRDRDAHIRRIRAEGFPNYTIKPEGKRDLYTSIIYLEPFAGRNLRAFGYDMYSEAMRREAMDRAADRNTTSISGKVALVQETGKDVQSGFLVYLPHYAKSLVPESAGERRQALLGYVYSVFRVNDLMNGIFKNRKFDVDFALFDREETDAARLYSYAEAHGLPRHAQPRLHAGREIEIYGRYWILKVSSRPGFEDAIDYGKSNTILGGGLIFSILLFSVFYALAVSRNRAVVIAENMTRELRHSENRTRAVLENVVDGIITISGQGLIESVNAAGERIFGYSAAELVGKNVKMLMPDPYHSEHDGYLHNYRRSGTRKIIGIGREVLGRRKDGSVFPLDLAVSEVPLDGRRSFTGIVRDITERKDAERQIREKTAMQQAIFNSANYSIISTDQHGLILTFNRAAENMLGRPATDVVGKVTPDAFHDQQEIQRKAAHLSSEFFREIKTGFEVLVVKASLGVPDEGEWTYIRSDGSRFPALLSVTALRCGFNRSTQQID